ncbi:phenazine-specific anthranilate synthase [Planctomonas sp. JC2975]|uniref:anthranilate synthase family protein n=1 Tax=Planctomonas sp. JC2975 TaxID=2729626 RepID=UPI001474055D|nr:anthranilate synthase family protein [Planctomonas sp. JC2975]NNC11391.1 phenazine-specific anthranilate synthase [Planctomonas sp. JC2975]
MTDTDPHPLLTELISLALAAESDDTAECPPFALLRREGDDHLEVLTGEVVDVDALADVPLTDAPVLAAVPYRQILERGFVAHDDGAPLRCLIASRVERVRLADALSLLPAHAPATTFHGPDSSDEEYEGIVRRVIDTEIGEGEGANFVIARRFEATLHDAPACALLAWMRALLTGENGAYWTFAVHLPAPLRSASSGLEAAEPVMLVGATPERHLTLKGGRAVMNPISGTYRHGSDGPTREALLDFLVDPKETDELFMVVDEELKLMSSLCPTGGRMSGPFLKRMSRLTHTEYLLDGRSSLDPREALRRTMFAPTVTGSPMENACRVIARHETRPRGYYSGVIALFEPEDDGWSLDAPILIRTARIAADGRVTVTAGATLVRHSDPAAEAAETRAKAAGILTALGLHDAPPRPAAQTGSAEAGAAPTPFTETDPEIAAALQRRNNALAPFWMREQTPTSTRFAGASVLVVDNEDGFTEMLAHQLRHSGMTVRVRPCADVDDVLTDDLVVFGPGPGDPRRPQPRINRLRALMVERIRSGRPLLSVCLSHQVLGMLAGHDVAPLAEPRQGIQLAVDVFGSPARVGFYNTFGVRERTESDDDRREVTLEPSIDANGVVTAFRAPGIASVQAHLESVLSPDGERMLSALIEHALATAGTAAGASPARIRST